MLLASYGQRLTFSERVVGASRLGLTQVKDLGAEPFYSVLWKRASRRRSVTAGLSEANLSHRVSSIHTPVPAIERNAERSQRTDMKQILAWVDGTDNDLAVLEHAWQVALRFGSHVDVLHVRFDISTARESERDLDRLLGSSVEHTARESAARAR